MIAFFLDFFEIAFIIMPLLAPVAAKLGIDLVWFGVLICANIQTSFMHPPFGFALFYLRGIAPPSVKTTEIYWGAIPWVVLQVILVVIVILWPQSVTYWIDRAPKIDPSEINIELPPAAAARPRFQSAAAIVAAASGARAVAHQEIVVGVFCDPPPQILVVAEREQRFPDLLEVGDSARTPRRRLRVRL